MTKDMEYESYDPKIIPLVDMKTRDLKSERLSQDTWYGSVNKITDGYTGIG